MVSTTTTGCSCCSRPGPPPSEEQVPQIPWSSYNLDGDAFSSEEDITDVSLGDIIDDSNLELSPLFARQNFVNIDDDKYLLLQPVLRLSTVIMSSHRALRFLNTVLFGKLVPTTGEFETLIDPNKGVLSATQEKMVQWILSLMAKDITYEFIVDQVGASTKKMRDRKARFLNGCGSLLDFPDNLHLLQRSTTTKALTMRHIWRLTTTLCHELAHAAWNYRVVAHEPHFAEICGSASELGFALESALFGGLHDVMDYEVAEDDFRQIDFYRPWPSWSVVRNYLNEGFSISVRGDPDCHLDLAIRVPLRLLATFFTSAHWSVWVDEKDLATSLPLGPAVVDVVGVEDLALPSRIRAMETIAGLPLCHRGMFSLREVELMQIALREVRRQDISPSEALKWLETVQPGSTKKSVMNTPVRAKRRRAAGLAQQVESCNDRNKGSLNAVRKMQGLREHGVDVNAEGGVSLLDYLRVSTGSAGRLGMLLQRTLKVPVRVSKAVLLTEDTPYTGGKVGSNPRGSTSKGILGRGMSSIRKAVRV